MSKTNLFRPLNDGDERRRNKRAQKPGYKDRKPYNNFLEVPIARYVIRRS